MTGPPEAKNESPRKGRKAWRKRAWFAGGVIVALWLAAGWRTVEPESLGVLQGPLFGGKAVRVEAGWVLAPPGLLRLTLYPVHGVELPLPGAEALMLRGEDGSRFGFDGWITLRIRPEAWESLHLSAAGHGMEGLLVDAVREAAQELGRGAARGVVTPTAARIFEQRLIEALAERGVELRRVELDAIDYLTVAEGETLAPPETRLLIVGLDGGDWEIIDPLIEQGRLPNLKRLIDEGVRAKLLSISPLLSPVIWTTVATGVEPSRHGVLDFLVEDPQTGTQQPVTSAQRQVPTFWEMLSRRGVGVGVVGWWASWPADPVRGYLVSDRLAYQLFGFRADPERAEGKTWPPDLYADIRPLVVAPESVGWERVEPFLDGDRKRHDQFDEEEQHLLDEFRTLLAAGDTYLSIDRELSRRFKPDLEVVYFEGTDTVGHLFMPYRLPELPGVDPGRIASFSQMVDRYYELADGFLGELLEGRGEDWTVLILSDHGFVSDAARPRTTDSRIGHGAAADWHRRFGMLVLSGAHVTAGAKIDEASVYDIAPTVMALFGQPIPRHWPGRVLAAALSEEFLERHPVRFRTDEPERRDVQSTAMIDPAAADLLAKLESLGYIAGDSGEGESVTARNNAGVALLAEGRFAEAEQEFRAGLESSPGAPMLVVNLALALRLQGELEEPQRLLRQAMTQPTTHRIAGQALAQIQLDEGDLEGAELLVREVLAAEPDAAESHNTLGLILERKGDLENARKEYLSAAELDPDGALARNNLGNLAKNGGRLDEAEDWYLRAIESDPYFMGAYNNLALVYQARGQIRQAIDLYGRALSKAPNNAVVLNNLGSLYYATGERDEARELWQRAANADPAYPSPLNNLASLHMTADRYDDAERLLRRALLLDENYGDARINLAMILRSRGETEAAREEYRLASLDPRSGVNSWFQWGLFEMEQERPADAARAFEEARKLAPRNTDLLNALGESYFRQGRRDEALAVWRQSLSVDPNQTRVKQVLDELSTP